MVFHELDLGNEGMLDLGASLSHVDSRAVYYISVDAVIVVIGFVVKCDHNTSKINN